jgi:MraZ protein
VFFSGSQKININAGGRIAIPTKYRDVIVSDEHKGQMFLTSHSFDDCLVLYPKAKFEDVAQQIRDIEDTAQAEIFYKIIIGQAVETEMDGQGRIMIPPSLRKIAHIEKEVSLVGQGESFQLWDARAWDDDFYDAREQAKALRQSGEVRLKL